MAAGGGLLIPVADDRDGWRAKTPMGRTTRIRSKVAGVSHRNDDGSDRQKLIRKYCQGGGELLAIPERSRYAASGTAIGLWVPSGRRPSKIGYIQDELVGDLLDHFKNGGGSAVRILDVTGGTRDKPSRGVNFEIELIPAEAKPKPKSRPKPKSERPANEWNLGDRLYVAARLTQGAFSAATRGLETGYRNLPDWAQPVVWGVGASTLLVLFALFLRLWR
jgi:hypothetical protein